jgi:hypothetical protein
MARSSVLDESAAPPARAWTMAELKDFLLSADEDGDQGDLPGPRPAT